MGWDILNEYLLIKIFGLLPLKDLASSSQICKHWNQISKSDAIWRKNLFSYFPCAQRNQIRFLPSGVRSWKSHFKNLYFSSPSIMTQEISDHGQEVTCISFSFDGSLLAACGSDAMIWVYKTGKQFSCCYEEDLGEYNWNEASCCEFNKSGTMLAVSGILNSDILGRTRGEILVFSLEDEYQICARISNDPYDSNGCWFNNKYIITSDFKWLKFEISATMLWINKIISLTSMDSTDHTLACMRRLYNFYNTSSNYVRQLRVANICPNARQTSLISPDELLARELSARENLSIGNVKLEIPPDLPTLPYHVDDKFLSLLREETFDSNPTGDLDEHASGGFNYRNEYYEANTEMKESGLDWITLQDDSESEDEDWEYYDEEKEKLEEALKPDLIKIDEGFEVINDKEKLLVFSTGNKYSVPHQIGIRKMEKVRFRQHIDLSKSLKQRERERRNKRREENERYQNMQEENITNWSNYPSVSHLFDHIDITFDFHGHISGMDVSPDHRFLYVTYQPWPGDIDHLNPPPIGQRTNCEVIDLITNESIGTLHRSQNAFVSNRNCIASKPSVTDGYLGICNGDNTASLFDRHFGIEVRTFDHDEKALSVAVNPNYEGMLGTSGKDGKIKIWMSRELVRLFNIQK